MIGRTLKLSSINMLNITRARLRSIFITTLTCFSLTACGAHYGAARFVSEPPGAEVINLDDGTVIGRTPVTMFWKDGNGTRKHIPIRLKKNGYYEKVTSFWLSMRHNSQEDALGNTQLVEVNMQKKGE